MIGNYYILFILSFHLFLILFGTATSEDKRVGIAGFIISIITFIGVIIELSIIVK